MKYINAEFSQHEMRLIQLGAKVEQISSKLCYIKFNINNIMIEYVYNINSKNQYFLERIKPYPLPIKSFSQESDIVDIIRVDIKQFKNAVKSKNIGSFVEINNELNSTIKRFEDLFLYYNVSSETVACIRVKIDELQQDIADAKATAERVFFDKEPDNLE